MISPDLLLLCSAVASGSRARKEERRRVVVGDGGGAVAKAAILGSSKNTVIPFLWATAMFGRALEDSLDDAELPGVAELVR